MSEVWHDLTSAERTQGPKNPQGDAIGNELTGTIRHGKIRPAWMSAIESLIEPLIGQHPGVIAIVNRAVGCQVNPTVGRYSCENTHS